MQSVKVPAYDKSDYLHPDETVELIDSHTNKRYGMMVKSGDQKDGKVFIYLPLETLEDTLTDGRHCILVLSEAKDKEESESRKGRFLGCVTKFQDMSR